MKLVTAVVKPHKWEDVRVALEAVGRDRDDGQRGQRLRPAEGSHGGLPRARSTTSPWCPRCGSRSRSATPTSTRSSARSRRPRRPAGSATARSGCHRSSRSSGSAPATATTRPSDRRPVTAADRAARAAEADKLCAAAYDGCGGPEVGAALVAVGGYGRAELAPYSDLDVVLVHDEGVELGEVAQQVWYPIWDSGRSSTTRCAPCRRWWRPPASDVRVASGSARRPAPGRRPAPHPAAAHHDARAVASRRTGAAAGAAARWCATGTG